MPKSITDFFTRDPAPTGEQERIDFFDFLQSAHEFEKELEDAAKRGEVKLYKSNILVSIRYPNKQSD